MFAFYICNFFVSSIKTNEETVRPMLSNNQPIFLFVQKSFCLLNCWKKNMCNTFLAIDWCFWMCFILCLQIWMSQKQQQIEILNVWKEKKNIWFLIEPSNLKVNQHSYDSIFNAMKWARKWVTWPWIMKISYLTYILEL